MCFLSFSFIFNNKGLNSHKYSLIAEVQRQSTQPNFSKPPQNNIVQTVFTMFRSSCSLEALVSLVGCFFTVSLETLEFLKLSYEASVWGDKLVFLTSKMAKIVSSPATVLKHRCKGRTFPILYIATVPFSCAVHLPKLIHGSFHYRVGAHSQSQVDFLTVTILIDKKGLLYLRRFCPLCRIAEVT